MLYAVIGRHESGASIIDEVIAAADGDAVTTQDYIYTLHKSQLEGAFTPSASGWVGTIADLPLYKKIDDNTYYVYSYAIDEVTVNGETVVGKSAADGIITGHTDDYAVDVNQATNTITNTERPKVDVEVTKAWQNADGTTVAPANGTVTFELYADGKTTGKTVELDGSVDTEAAYIKCAQPEQIQDMQLLGKLLLNWSKINPVYIKNQPLSGVIYTARQHYMA